MAAYQAREFTESNKESRWWRQAQAVSRAESRADGNTLQGSTSNKLHSCDLQVRVDEGEHSPEWGVGGGGVCGPPLAYRESVEAFWRLGAAPAQACSWQPLVPGASGWGGGRLALKMPCEIHSDPGPLFTDACAQMSPALPRLSCEWLRIQCTVSAI